MEYLNQYRPVARQLKERQSLREFTQRIEEFSVAGTGRPRPFNPEKIVLKEPRVVIEFLGRNGEPVFEIFETRSFSPRGDDGFMAVEMFYHILEFQNKINSWNPFFESVEPVPEKVEEIFSPVEVSRKKLKGVPVYRANFCSSFNPF